jgi:hypothetical protein
MAKQVLVDKIRRWLEVEGKVNEHTKELKVLRKEMKALSLDLTNVMRENSLDNLNVNNVGQILYTKKEVKKGINKKYLTMVLNRYYTDPMVAKELYDFILENRETSVQEKVRFKRDS